MQIDDDNATRCDECEYRNECSDIFVNLKKIESAMAHKSHPEFRKEYLAFSFEVKDSGFQFPFGVNHCYLKGDPTHIEVMRRYSETLLEKTRP